MTSLAQALPYTLLNEGGYGWDKGDSGGPTKWGITQGDLARFRGYPVSPDEVKNMPMSDCEAIYQKYYWQPSGVGSLSDQNKATAIFDTCVLDGLTTGVMYAQRAVNACAPPRLLSVDGHLGPLSRAAIDTVDRLAFLRALAHLLNAHYESIVSSNPKDQRFLRGWENRDDRLLTLA